MCKESEDKVIKLLVEQNNINKDIIKALEEQIELLKEHIHVIKRNPSSTALHNMYELLEARGKLGFSKVKGIIKSHRG